MKKKQGIITLIAFAVIAVLLGYTTAVGFGPTGTGSAKNIKTGLDLSGGVSITYEVTGEDPSQEDMDDTIYKLQKRVESYSEEAAVYQEGDDRITVEIPGVSDANAILEELGKPGSLEFQDEDGETVLEGSDIADAQGTVTEDSTTGLKEYVVSLTLTSDGADKFAEATEENLGKTIAIVYDGETISAPTVESVISDGKAQISGQSSLDEAEELASIIRIGALKLELSELSSNVVGAQLGQSAIKTSVVAGAIGIVIVAVFMIIVYALPGVVAALALFFYVGLELLMLNAFDLTLTLSGIAGIILSMGMAVDANVIIYARVREELGVGRSVKNAINTGFKKSMSAIFDGNITTLIAAAVLGMLGTGTVKGFAMTLALGIVLSMFTALVVSRLLINAFYAIGLRDEKFYGKQKPRRTIHFTEKRKLFFTISIVLILLAPVSMGIYKATTGQSLNFSLEFVGGTSTTVPFNEEYTIDEIDEQIKPVIAEAIGDDDIQASKVADSNSVIFKTRTLTLEEREALNTALEESFDVDTTAITAQNISSTISSEMTRDAIRAVVVAMILMLIYIWLRFKDIRFASSAVLALLHDVAVVLAFYSIARISVSGTFIGCMLTIVGYSINATIVIFDRIRENLTGVRKPDYLEIVDQSITETLTRSIYTSLTTFITIFTLAVLGVSSIREFALPIMVGIVCGAYSSVCVTGPLWYVMKTKVGKGNKKASGK